MKKLNVKATKLFLMVLSKLKGLTEIVLPVKDHPDLLVRKGQSIHTKEGGGYLLTIATLAKAWPEKYEYCMVFLVVDHREKSGLRLDISIYPVSTKDDLNDVEEYCIFIRENTVSSFLIHLQRAHAKG